MMKAKQMLSKKLFLRKETIATLSPVELDSVKGGFTGISCTGLNCVGATYQTCTASGVVDNYSMNCL
jgi:hypothetical protein